MSADDACALRGLIDWLGQLAAPVTEGAVGEVVLAAIEPAASSIPRTRRARRCAGSARRSGASPAPRPFMLSPVDLLVLPRRSQSGKQGDGEHSQAENDSRYPSYFDVGKPSPS